MSKETRYSIEVAMSNLPLCIAISVNGNEDHDTSNEVRVPSCQVGGFSTYASASYLIENIQSMHACNPCICFQIALTKE